MKNLFLCVFLMLFITNASFCQDGKTIDLKFNLQKGSGYLYNAVVDMNMKMSGADSGQAMTVTNQMNMGYDFKVIDDSAGWKKVATTFSHIGMKVNAAGVNIDYDSEKPVDTTDVMNNTVSKVFGAMKGSAFTFIMNKQGDIGYVSGVNEMREKMLASVAPGNQMANGVGGSFSEEAFKQNMQQSFGFYPDKPIKVGDTWTKTTHASNNGLEMTIDNVYTLESVKGNVAGIKVDSKISSEGGVPLTGTLKGNIQYDIPSGILETGNLDMLMTININAGGQSTTMNMDVKTSMTGKKS